MVQETYCGPVTGSGRSRLKPTKAGRWQCADEVKVGQQQAVELQDCVLQCSGVRKLRQAKSASRALGRVPGVGSVLVSVVYVPEQLCEVCLIRGTTNAGELPEIPERFHVPVPDLRITASQSEATRNVSFAAAVCELQEVASCAQHC